MTDFEMQKQEAIERVRRMNQNNKNRVSGQEKASKNEPRQDGFLPSVMNLFKFDALKTDPDRLLLLGVLLLLYSEKADEKLMYAILYIMI